MDPGQALYRLRKRKSPRRARPGGLDTEDSLASRNRPNYLEPWIVTLLLEYKESVTKTDGQIGHVLKVLNEPKVHQDAEQGPETILCIGDGHHYIEVVVAAKAGEMTKSSIAQSGFSGILGQFIILQNYRVCFKAATKMEDCQFYLILECFRVMPMKREEKRLRDCNQEPSVLQKIKELWQKSFVLQPWFSSESPSVSQVLKEINQDQLSTLKQNAKNCLNLLDPSKLLDSEQLAVYPDTKWQLERKQDKMHQDIFAIPAKFLVISAENEAALSQSYTAKTPQAVPEADENIQEDDRSTISFFSAADSASLDGSLENPWDAFPGITLSSSSDTSGTSPGLPQTQQMLLASPAEEANPHSNACASDFLEPRNNMPNCSSEQAAPVRSSTLLHSHDSEFPKGAANQESGLIASTTASQASQIADNIPCGQPLSKSHLHSSVHLYSPVCHSTEGNFFERMSGNRKDCLSHAQRAKRMTARWKYLETAKCVSSKRKQRPNEEEPSETFSSPTCSNNLEGVGQCSTETVAKSTNPSKKHQYPPLKFVSTPKKRRFKEIQDQQSCVCPQCGCTERLPETGSEQEPIGIITRKSKQTGVQQKESVKGDRFHNPPTPELCSQVQSVRISRALLGWARWVFSNMQKQ
ncbi:adrenocortical dysplasia protein homolog isoform 3-T3 [Liasis olivaceus]